MWKNAVKPQNGRAGTRRTQAGLCPRPGSQASLQLPPQTLQTVSSSAGKGLTGANGSRHSPASSLWLGSAGPTPGSLPSGEETQRTKCPLPCSWLTHRHGPRENAGTAGTGPGSSGCPRSSNMAEEDGPSIPHGQSRGSGHPKCLWEEGQGCGAGGPEGGKEGGRKGGMPPGQHLWHQGTLRVEWVGRQKGGTVQLAGD